MALLAWNTAVYMFYNIATDFTAVTYVRKFFITLNTGCYFFFVFHNRVLLFYSDKAEMENDWAFNCVYKDIEKLGNIL